MADPATSTAAQAPASSQPPAPTAETSATAQAPAVAPPAAGTEPPDAKPRTPGFGERGRMRRRLRFLRKARELAYRDLGGLVFEMHRLGERHDELASAKLATLGAIDDELHALEGALADRRPVTVLREAGIAACPRCAAIHGSEDRFCPACGTPMGRRAERPIATAGAAPLASPAAGGSTGTPASPPAPTAAAPAPPAVQPAPAPAAPAAPAVQPAPAPPARPTSTSQPAPARAAQPAPTPTPATRPAPRAPAAPAAGRAGEPPPAAKPRDDRPTEIIRPSDTDADERG